jgi:transcriptional regulator, propionate catabolism operon regulatory protein
VVAATHRSLAGQIETGEFRADLYYRLNILNLAIPPLRERAEDVVPLAAELLLQAARREPRVALRVRTAEAAGTTLAPIAQALAQHDWPGNVRELQNVVERIVVELADTDVEAIPVDVLRTIAPEVFDSAGFAQAVPMGAAKVPMTLRERSLSAEAEEIRAALEACGGNRDRVCELLGISKTTLWRRLAAVREVEVPPAAASPVTPPTGMAPTPSRKRRSRGA